MKVAFDYRDGVASDVAVVIPCGLSLLDQAALETVRAAHFAAPPASLAHRSLHLSIEVQYDPVRFD